MWHSKLSLFWILSKGEQKKLNKLLFCFESRIKVFYIFQKALFMQITKMTFTQFLDNFYGNIFNNKNVIIVDEDLWVMMGTNCQKSLLIQKCRQFYKNCPQAMLAWLQLFHVWEWSLLHTDIASLKSRVDIIAWFISYSKVTLERANLKEAISSKIIGF